MKLGDFDITFQPRQAIKGQALADFIVECTRSERTGENIGCWKLPSTNGSGAEIMLESPRLETFEHSLRFEFPSSNNIAKYEALITGMMLNEKLQVRSLTAFSDSQLMVTSIMGSLKHESPLWYPISRKSKN